MEYFAQDAVYVEYNGRVNMGKDAIRKAFEPQFNGCFGKMTFHDKDFFYDAASRKALFNWWCSMELNGSLLKWEGLDIFTFDEKFLIKEKRTFSQAEIPKFIPGKYYLFPKFIFNIVRKTLF